MFYCDQLCELDFQFLDHKQCHRPPPPNIPSVLRHCLLADPECSVSECLFSLVTKRTCFFAFFPIKLWFSLHSADAAADAICEYSIEFMHISPYAHMRARLLYVKVTD